MRIRLGVVIASLCAVACGGSDMPDAGTDAGPVSFCRVTTDGGLPGEGACCYRASQTGVDEPELRLRYIDILEPEGSSLMTPVLLGVLNDALARESFNWLFRIEFPGAPADGPIEIRTGFGFGPPGGPYQFPTGAMTTPFDTTEYAPVVIPGTISGETVMTETFPGALTVPVLNTEGTAVQLELVLQNVRVIQGTFSEQRSCVGRALARGYEPAATLEGWIEVETARTGMVVSGPIMTTVCAAIAGDLSMATYCEDVPQAMWTVRPDSLCDGTGCRQNAAGMSDVCDPSTTCNAWRLLADFAAQGVEITN